MTSSAIVGAGMTPSDVDGAEMRDYLTPIDIIRYECLGFADRFGAGKLVETEVTSVGVALPVNPRGGPKVDGPRIGLAHNIGGPTAASAVTILEGPERDG